MKMLTTKQVAEHLGVSVRRVHQFIEEGRLPAEKVGRDYLINEKDLNQLAIHKVGRPKKDKKSNKGKS